MMCEIESATSPSTPPPASPLTASRMKDDKCFNCQKQGHWARDCPEKTPKISTVGILYPRIPCRCGNGACLLLVSKTERNPDRKFYVCPVQGSGKCGFFKWCDEVEQKDTKLTDNVVVPKCPCGAGTCTKWTKSGRSYFICPIKKGFGACSFFEWEDTLAFKEVNELVRKDYGSPQSMCDSHKVFDIVNSDLQIEQQERMEFSTSNPQDYPNSEVLPASAAKAYMQLTENQESGKTSDISSAKEHDPPSCLAPLSENSVPKFTEGDLAMPEAEPWDSMVQKASVVRLMSQYEIHCRQMEFWRQISAATTDIAYQSLGLQVLGWMGRLVFPPPRCLKDRPPTPFFCGIFPGFDPILVPQDRDILSPVVSTPLPHHLSSDYNHEKLSPQNPVQDLQLWNGDLQKPSGLKRPSTTLEDHNKTSVISKYLEQTAIHLQNQLVMILNSIDPSDHDSMKKAAQTFFSLLDGLSVNYGAFSGCVREFINSASRLSGIEQSICNGHSLQDCIELYDGEKARFSDISEAHEKAVAAFTSSSKRLQSLHEEASRVRDMLDQIENQLLCCQKETSELQTHVDVINRDMLDSKRSMQKAEEALKLCELRKEEHCAAKAALEKIVGCWSTKEACGLHLWKRRKV